MKKLIISSLLLIVAIAFAGCNRKPEKLLLENASPQNSAMAFYYFDGENTEIKYLFDVAEEQRIIDEINGLKTKKVEAENIGKMNVPTYAIEICDEEGYGIWLTYSNGFWLLKDGSVYKAEYDLKHEYDNVKEVSDTIKGGICMPNASYLAEYDVRYYNEVKDMTDTRDGVTLSVFSYRDNIVTVQLQNNSDADFFYSEYYTLQKNIEGTWYTVPVKLSNYGFNDIGLILPAHESHMKECNLVMYGDLEPGLYRIEKEKMAAEFTVE